jgi:hypothetical protein
MVRKSLSLTLLFSILMMISTRVLAQGSDRGPDMAITIASPVIHPLEASPAGLVKLYSNLGSKTDAYDDNLAWVVFGPGTGFQQWMAMPFTPKANATIRQIKVAVGNEGGTNSVTLLLSSDAGGVPGKTIHKWEVKNLFTWGGCCSLDLAKTSGVKVKKGKLYWIVAETDSTNSDAQDVWAYTWNHAMGDIAFNTGAGWQPSLKQVLAAYAVYGTKP